MKRILSAIIILTLMLSLVPLNVFAATDAIVYTEASTSEVYPGDSFTYSISLSGTYDGYSLEFSKEQAGLTITSVTGEAGVYVDDRGNTWMLSVMGGLNKVSSAKTKLATVTVNVDVNAATGTKEIGFTNIAVSNDIGDRATYTTELANVVVISKPVATTGVILNKESLSLNTGESETLIATVSPDNATNKTVSWKSSDSTVATVDNNGKVTAVKKGTATITVTTEDGDFPATCKVSVACSHTNTTVHPANASTCVVQGNAEYTTCNDCGIVVSGSDAKLPFADHKGGTATCKDKAICNVCSQLYGNYGSHTLTNHPRNEADHDNAGNIEYWTCDVCDKYFSDANGTTVISQADTIIEKVPHSHSTDWSKNDTQHWRECGCGNKIEIDTHKYTNDCDTSCNVCGYTRTITHDWNTTYTTDGNGHWIECKECGAKKNEGTHNGGTATCKDKAVCDICNQAYGSLANHSYKEIVDVKYRKDVATCVSAAVYYKSCEVCEIASTTETFTNGGVDGTNHVGGTYLVNQREADCVNKGYTGDKMCNSCRNLVEAGTEIPVGAHNPDSVWSTDAEYHWKDCNTVGCGNLIDKAVHSGGTATCKNKAICSVCKVEYGTTNAANHAGETEIKNAVAATCTTDGYTGDTYCKDCGVKIADGKTVEAGHKTVKVAAVPATHEKDGNIEYYTCSGCDKLFSDEKATTEITLADTVIAKGEHNYGNTYESDADNHWKACGCGNVIEKAAHTFVEWSVTKEATETEKGSKEKICSVCGYKVVEEIPAIKGDDTTNTDNDTNTDTDADTNNGTTNDDIPEKSPQTGDTSNIFLWIAILSLSGLAIVGTTVLKKKVR